MMVVSQTQLVDLVKLMILTRRQQTADSIHQTVHTISMGLQPAESLGRTFLKNLRTNSFLHSSSKRTEEAKVARKRRSPPDRASVWKTDWRGGK